MAAFLQEGEMPVDKDWFTMAASRRTVSSEHSTSKDVGLGSRTEPIGDLLERTLEHILHEHQQQFSLVTLSNPHPGVREK